MLNQFKDFLIKTNVVDLSVAVIIGGAFAHIVSSIVDDIVTPLLLTHFLRTSNVGDIANLTWGVIRYGTFAAAVIKFVIIAFVLFLIVRLANKLRKDEVQDTSSSS